ncbi:hypothetical protein HK405_013767, partial [Cladochytrium tenue]
LVALALKTVPDAWTRPVAGVCAALEAAAAAAPEARRPALRAALLNFLTVLPEEMRKAVFSSEPRRARFFAAVQDDTGLAMEAALRELRTALPTVVVADDGGALEEACALKRQALRCVLSWTVLQSGLSTETMSEVYSLIIEHLRLQSTYEAACQVLVELLALQSTAKYERTVCEGLMPVLTTEEDTLVAQPLCELLSQFCETFSRFVARNLARPDVVRLLNMVLAFTNFPGHFGVDEELSSAPHQFWYELVETLTDGTTVPQPQNGASTKGDEATHPSSVFGAGGPRLDASALIARHRQLTAAGNAAVELVRAGGGGGGGGAVWDIAVETFAALVLVVRDKVRRPQESEWLTWKP